jgi:hypothetical protein
MEFHLSWTAPLPTCFTAASVRVILGSILAVFAPAPWLIWTAVVANRRRVAYPPGRGRKIRQSVDNNATCGANHQFVWPAPRPITKQNPRGRPKRETGYTALKAEGRKQRASA